jgi:DNA-binding response OmpR family regulator
MAMRLLLVEDEEVLGRYTSQELLRHGITVDWVRTGQDAGFAARTQAYDVVLLDLGLPDTSGEGVLREIRARRAPTAVIVITARGQTDDRVSMLDMGADDYIVKPFDLKELLARIRAVQRRSTGAVDLGDVQRVGPLELFQASRKALWHGEPMELSSREYDVLEVLVLRRPSVVTREQLHDALYGWGDEVQSNAIEVYVHMLRKKFSRDLIVTVRGRGYQMGSAELIGGKGPDTSGARW